MVKYVHGIANGHKKCRPNSAPGLASENPAEVTCPRCTGEHSVSPRMVHLQNERFVGKTLCGHKIRQHTKVVSDPAAATCYTCRGGALSIIGGDNYRHGALAAMAGTNRSKSHCPAGHEYTAANIYRSPSAPNKRRCRACARGAKKTVREASGPIL